MKLNKFLLPLTMSLSVFFALSCKPTGPRPIRQTKAQKNEKPGNEDESPKQRILPSSVPETTLHEACRKAKPDSIRVLLSQGADPHEKDSSGLTPWEFLWNRERYPDKRFQECFFALAEGGYQLPEEPDEQGRTWLHKVAGKCSHHGLVTVLVKSQGFEVDARDSNGWTPLHVAAFHGKYDSAKALLDLGADVNAETTKMIVEKMPRGEITMDRFRYEAGSRPLDLHYLGWTRGAPDFKALLKEKGGSNNPKVKNVFAR